MPTFVSSGVNLSAFKLPVVTHAYGTSLVLSALRLSGGGGGGFLDRDGGGGGGIFLPVAEAPLSPVDQLGVRPPIAPKLETGDSDRSPYARSPSMLS